MLNRLTYKHLQDWFNFVLKVKEITVSLKDLGGLSFALLIGYKDSVWSSVNEVVWFETVLVCHVVVIVKLVPDAVVLLHLGHLHAMLVVLHLLGTVVFFIPSPSDLVSALLLVGLFHFLFLDQRRVWLHVYRDY